MRLYWGIRSFNHSAIQPFHPSTIPPIRVRYSRRYVFVVHRILYTEWFEACCLRRRGRESAKSRESCTGMIVVVRYVQEHQVIPILVHLAAVATNKTPVTAEMGRTVTTSRTPQNSHKKRKAGRRESVSQKQKEPHKKRKQISLPARSDTDNTRFGL